MASHVMDLEALGLVGEDAGAASQGLRDNAPVWNANVPNAAPGTSILLPPNYISFKTPLLPLPSNVELVGSGQGSHMVRNFSQAAGPEFFVTTGVNDCTVRNVRLWAGEGTSGGAAIGRIATNINDPPFHTVLEHIETTHFNTGSFWAGVYLDGIKGPANYGTRRHEFDSIILGCCSFIGMWLGGAVSCEGYGLMFSSAPPNPTWGLWLYGQPGVQPCSGLILEGQGNGTVLMYATLATKLDLAVAQDYIVDGNCASVGATIAFCAQTPKLYGQNCWVLTNGQIYKS